jgi:hypothetical protein
MCGEHLRQLHAISRTGAGFPVCSDLDACYWRQAQTNRRLVFSQVKGPEDAVLVFEPADVEVLRQKVQELQGDGD